MDIKELVLVKAREAKEGARNLARISSSRKNSVLVRMAEALSSRSEELIAENKKDIEIAEKKGFSKALVDRLTLTGKRIQEMTSGLLEVAQLPDPVGEITNMRQRPNGMAVGRMRVPIGVIGIIYEARPNVTADATGLCLKAGNAVVLRGGSEALHSNRAIVNVLREVACAEGIHEGAVTFIDIPEREAVMEMLKLEGLIDLIKQYVTERSGGEHGTYCWISRNRGNLRYRETRWRLA